MPLSSAEKEAAERGDLDLIRLMVEKESSILLEEDANHNTIAHISAQKGHLNIILYIAEKNSSVFVRKNLDGENVLELAVRRNCLDMKTLKMLVEDKHIPLDEVNALGETVAHIAAMSGNLDIVRYVVEKTPLLLAMETERHDTIAHVAAHHRHINIIQYVAKKDPSILLRKNSAGSNAIHLAVKKHILKVETLTTFVEELGMPLNETDRYGYTIAHIAAKVGDLSIVRYVAEKDPSVAASSIKFKDGSKNIARIAYDHNQWAIVWGIGEKWPSILLEGDNDMFHLAIKKNKLDVDTLKFFVEKKGIPLTKTYIGGYTIAHIAARLGNLNITQYVLEKNPSLQTMVTKKRGYTVAHVAVVNSHFNILKYLSEKNPSLLKMVTPPKKKTIAHIAAKMGDLITLQFILEKSPSLLSKKDYRKKTVAHIAAEKKFWNIVWYVVVQDVSLLGQDILQAAVKEKIHAEMIEGIACAASQSSKIDALEKVMKKIEKYLSSMKLPVYSYLYGSEKLPTFLEAIHPAIQKKKYSKEIITFVLREHPQLFAQDSNKLYWLALEQNLFDVQVVKMLVEKKYVKNIYTRTAHFAVTTGNLELLEYVFKGLPLPHVRDEGNGDSATLIAARNCHSNIIDFIVKKAPATLMDTNHDLENIAHIATKNGCLDIIHYIVKENPTLFVKEDRRGETAFLHAVKHRKLDLLGFLIEKDPSFLGISLQCINSMFKLLGKEKDVYNVLNYVEESLEKCVPNWNRSGFQSAVVHSAIQADYSAVLEYVLIDANITNECGEPPIFTALRHKRYYIFKYLVENRNANLTLVNNEGDNILYVAAEIDNLSIMKYIWDTRKAPLNINWQNNVGDTVSHVAIRRAVLSGDTAILKYLIEEKHADVNLKGKGKKTLRHYATQYRNYPIANYLLDHGADFAIKDEEHEQKNSQKLRQRRSVLSNKEKKSYFLEARTMASASGVPCPIISYLGIATMNSANSYGDFILSHLSLSNFSMLNYLS